VGATATWDVDPAHPQSKEARHVVVLVTRVSCSGGKTGRVQAPLVVEEATTVVVTYTEPLPPGASGCSPAKTGRIGWGARR
jgi:hypothetical protein